MFKSLKTKIYSIIYMMKLMKEVATGKDSNKSKYKEILELWKKN